MSATAVASVQGLRSARARTRRRSLLVLGALAAGAVGLFWANVLLGSYTVTLPDFFRILAGETIPGASFIVMQNKLPQTVLAVLVGAAFGTSGAVFQTMLRNPLASPDIIGITSGSSATAVFAIAVFGASGVALSAYSLAGALAVAFLMYAMSMRKGVAGQRLVLIGIGLAAMLTAVTSYFLTRTDVRVAAEALVWLNGSLNNATWQRVAILAAALALLLPATAAAARALPPLELGDDAAAGLGLAVERHRLALVLLGVALAAVATAAAGPVAFVAFLSGPIARRVMGGRASLAAAAIVGSLIVLSAEYLSVNLIPETALPVGVITGALGGPFLIWLLVTTNRVGRGG